MSHAIVNVSFCSGTYCNNFHYSRDLDIIGVSFEWVEVKAGFASVYDQQVVATRPTPQECEAHNGARCEERGLTRVFDKDDCSLSL